MAITSTSIVTLYDDAAKTKGLAPRTKVEAISNNAGTGLQALLDGKMSSKPTFIEFGASNDDTLNEGYIDWHWNGSSADYTSRLIESASGTLSVNGVTFNNNKITSGTWNGSAIGAAYGGTGQTSLINSANTLLNALSTGSSTPQDADYFISQYVGGGTTTTTYHRRPVSALWTYIKGKADSVYSASGHNHDSAYVNVSGDTMTGNLTVKKTTTDATSVFVTNSNGTITLHASTNKGVYDTDAGAWLIYKEKSSGYTKIPGKVVLTNSTDLAGTAYNGPALTIGGEPTAAHIEIDANEIVAKANATTTATLWLGDGSKVVADNNLFKGDESTNVPAVFISSSQPTAKQTGDLWLVP